MNPQTNKMVVCRHEQKGSPCNNRNCPATHGFLRYWEVTSLAPDGQKEILAKMASHFNLPFPTGAQKGFLAKAFPNVPPQQQAQLAQAAQPPQQQAHSAQAAQPPQQQAQSAQLRQHHRFHGKQKVLHTPQAHVQQQQPHVHMQKEQKFNELVEVQLEAQFVAQLSVLDMMVRNAPNTKVQMAYVKKIREIFQ